MHCQPVSHVWSCHIPLLQLHLAVEELRKGPLCAYQQKKYVNRFIRLYHDAYTYFMIEANSRHSDPRTCMHHGGRL